MYTETQKALGKGLSALPRILLGLISGLFGVAMILIASDMEKPVAIYGFGAFCLVISIMTVATGVVRHTIGRLIGFVVFCLSVWYFIGELTGGVVSSGSRSEPSLINAIFFFIVFGLPGIWFAVKGKFPMSQTDIVSDTFDSILSRGFDVNNSPFQDKVVVMVTIAQGVIDNGGFEYFFESEFEGNPKHEEFVTMYSAIGAEESANAISSAISAYNSGNTQSFDDLESVLFDNSAANYELLEKYIKSHY